jgi:hypothetical protein
MSDAEAYSKHLNSTCWNARIGRSILTYHFEMQPTYFKTGGTYKLKWFDGQIIRDHDVLYAFRDKVLVLEIVYGNTRFTAQYAGGSKIRWGSEKGESMVWEQVNCFDATDISQSQGYISYP